MLRSLSAMFVVIGLLFAVPHLQVQAQAARAYAPENLRSLSRNDQERVIRQEYSDQSNGRRIPDDQLRFYIDQVNRSNWGFSRIKQDIATSLGGNGNGGWNPGPGPGQSGSVLCESQNNRYRECRTNFRGNAVLVQNISQTRCIEGQNWGSRDGMVWVDRGCKARFAQGSSNGNGTVRCESDNGRVRTCNTGFRNNAVISRQLSSTRCVEGQNWGQSRGSVWVSSGCRAEFTEGRGGWNPGPGNGNYSVTCNSANGGRNTCAWDSRQGRPMVIQQLSSTPCREGSTWGYSGNQIWVDRGCRARFGTR